MYSLRWYQSESVEAAWDYLCTHPGNPCIVLPTGSGKSIVIAEVIRRSLEHGKRIMCLAHLKELLEQNADKVRALIPDAEMGIYSAGLGLRNTESQIIFAGIQSVHKRAFEFGERHLVIVDECHLTPQGGEGMYRTFFDDIRTANPGLRTVGLTATPFRTGEGSLVGSSKLFQKVCYDAPIQKLIEEGFLSKVVNTSAAASYNTSKLHKRAGEFVPHEMQTLFSSDIGPACREIVAKTAGRKSVLVFCSGVDHAEMVTGEIEQATGEDVGLVHGGTLPLIRAAILGRFKARSLRWLINVDVLTTGFDAPCIDCIAILRATASPGLFAQIVGRGFRLYPAKSDFLVLDFGENIQRHGPIDAIDYGKPNSTQGGGDAPVKSCPNCQTTTLIAARECLDCGYKFPEPELAHKDIADEQSKILAEPERWLVVTIDFARHVKKNAPDAPNTLRVDYECQPFDGPTGNLTGKTISEWVCIEHEGFARGKAVRWWRDRSISDTPDSIDDAIDLWRRGAIAGVQTLTTIKDGHFNRITSATFDDLPTEWADEAVEDPFSMEVF